MRRREFIITLLRSAAVAWPLVARAQPVGKLVVGYLTPALPGADAHLVTAFREGLSETGYVQDKNVTVEYRSSNGEYGRLRALADELVHRRVAVIATVTPVATLAAKQATTAIPIVFSLGSDPVKAGLVSSLSRPGGNITGATFFSNLLVAKRLEFLHQLVPDAKIVAVLLNPENPNAGPETSDTRVAAHALGLELIVLHASTEGEIEDSFATLNQKRAAALIVAGDSFLSGHADQIVKLAARYLLPTSFYRREHAAAGGLMSYGASLSDTVRQAGHYVGRILDGEKPGDLPVQQPTKFALVINKKTAKALGLQIPDKILALANEVIE